MSCLLFRLKVTGLNVRGTRADVSEICYVYLSTQKGWCKVTY